MEGVVKRKRRRVERGSAGQMLSQRRRTRLASDGAGVMLWMRLRLKAVSRMSDPGCDQEGLEVS
jgi:hypothetical protein